uniref:putative leucine-rich repeat receptor-like protein kinase At2g19210 n=1 Tax=Erigeron canadensis TaxID=72917 RepID=UPI001CB9C27E|nr:putative leucine-rich repeat receptor-like protein kinase At2g19210 [Erigeron canadensis]
MDNHLWLLFQLLALCTISVSGKVFVSIDCGASGSFKDENSIEWKGDSDLISNGVTHVVQSNYSVSQVLDTLRVFTTRKKNCYSVDVEEGEKILVRAGFNYGNYDKKLNPPVFDLLFDGNFWVTVNTTVWKRYEVIYVTKRNVISICVAQKNPNQFPFISTLEVRSLDSRLYNEVGENYALFRELGTAYAVNETIRFPKDPYDRIWVPAALSSDNGLVNLTNTATLINNDVPNNPPQAVLENAISTPNVSRTITTSYTIIDYPIRYPVYFKWYFTEVKVLNSTESRSFIIYKDNEPFSLPITPHFGNVTDYFISNLTYTTEVNFTIEAIGSSTLPPLLNAFEGFSISDLLTEGTNNNDVEGLTSLQNAFSVLQEWRGDPCLPAPYSWEWIQCNNDPTPRVTALNLSSFNLSGPLPDFSKMDALKIIDLHNNSLTGKIPNFLGTMPNLKKLNLADNQFSGSLPRSLTRNSDLNLSDTGNPLLCTKGKSCAGDDKNKTNKLPIILGITIPVFIICCAIVGVLLVRHNQRKAGVRSHSGSTSRGAIGLSSGTRGTIHDDLDEKSAEDKERFYSSPAPLLSKG